MDVIGYIHEATNHNYQQQSQFLRFKRRLCPGVVMAWLVQFLSINSASQGIFISLLNKGKSNGLEEIFTHRRKLSPTFRMLYVEDSRIFEDESLSKGCE